MASRGPSKAASRQQPGPFSRVDGHDNQSVDGPGRASSFHNGLDGRREDEEKDGIDAFDTSSAGEAVVAVEAPRTSVDLEDLPIELVSMTDK